jgi:hypothetical protein
MSLKFVIVSIGIGYCLSQCSVNNNSVDNAPTSNKDSSSLTIAVKDSVPTAETNKIDTIDYAALNSKFKQNVLTKLKKGETYTKEYKKGDLIESFQFLGTLLVEGKVYRGYYFFKKIKVAIDYRGQSRIVFLGLDEMISYHTEIDAVPTEIESGKLYFGKEYVFVKSLGEMLVIPHDGLVREDKLESRIISSLKMY